MHRQNTCGQGSGLNGIILATMIKLLFREVKVGWMVSYEIMHSKD